MHFYTVFSLAVLSLGCRVVPDDSTPQDTHLEDSVPNDTGDSDEPAAIDCGISIPASPEGATCIVSSDLGTGMVIRGDILLPEGALRGGSVLIATNGEIQCVGCDCSDAEGFAEATQIDCAEGVISPGLINPHDHIGYTEGAPIDHGTTRYDHRHEWRGSLSTPQNSGDGSQGRRWGEIRMLMSGVTSMVGSGHQEGLVRNLEDANDLEGLDIAEVNNETFPLGDANETFHGNCAWDYKDTESEVAGMNTYLPHVAEGINGYAAEEFRCQANGFIGEDLTETNTAHVHGIGLTTTDYYNMADNGAQLIWSPRSNISLYGQTAQIALFHRLGGIIALGTDWTYSGSVNMSRELACAAYLNENYYDHAFTSEDLWRMATFNGAMTVGAENLIGQLSVGAVADITIFARHDYDLWDAAVYAGTTDVALVLRGGTALYGEAALLESMNAGCDPLTVCEQARALCATSETGFSYTQIQAAIPNAYPAFFCGETPDNEPTCVPSRPDEYNGTTEDDLDGDGIVNAVDLCATVFDPIRPIDDDEQPDLDQDGIGDACDETPLPIDLDGDGTANDADLCPEEADEQVDADGDGKGDVCDPCASEANPDHGCAG